MRKYSSSDWKTKFRAKALWIFWGLSKAALKAAMWTKQLRNFLTGFSRVPGNLSFSHFFVLLLWSKPKSSNTRSPTQPEKQTYIYTPTHILALKLKLYWLKMSYILFIYKLSLFITSFWYILKWDAMGGSVV